MYRITEKEYEPKDKQNTSFKHCEKDRKRFDFIFRYLSAVFTSDISLE